MCTGNLKTIYQKDTLTRTLFGSLFQNNYPQPALLWDTSLGAKPGISTKTESIAPDLEVLTNLQGKIIISGREKKKFGNSTVFPQNKDPKNEPVLLYQWFANSFKI